MTTKQEFFNTVKKSHQFAGELTVMENRYYDFIMWEGDKEEETNALQAIANIKFKLQIQKNTLAKMRKSFTHEQLKEMRKEYYSE
ncbi:hypothetical protein QUF99_16875 [Bacillus sp. DX4.1]|uniref:hypothetical protein n=1 Tax=Bacillus sp. DX4.1 TaxID=3055867 RepID=UPI0025A1E957|nr:hypothetical protein [Bacillus sp. DX4.1]MDM5188929.1 hypothetical protein [Bacillus sp. DX4.1]